MTPRIKATPTLEEVEAAIGERPWYLGNGPDARVERIRRGLEDWNGEVLALSGWETRREEYLRRLATAEGEQS